MSRPLGPPVDDDSAGWRPPATAGSEPVPAWAEKLVRWLDDIVRVPGTNIGIGLDGLVGMLLPGAGDALTALGSVSLLFLALRSGVPTVVLGRMILNIALDALLGAVPLVGDLFDFAWKANRKNLELIERYRGDPQAKPGAADYALVGTGLVLIALSILLPLLFLLTVGAGIGSILGR